MKGSCGSLPAGGADPGQGGLEQDGMAAYDLFAEGEEAPERQGWREGVEIGVLDGRDGFGEHGVEHGSDQGVA